VLAEIARTGGTIHQLSTGYWAVSDSRSRPTNTILRTTTANAPTTAPAADDTRASIVVRLVTADRSDDAEAPSNRSNAIRCSMPARTVSTQFTVTTAET
jgi:hypothetical protein